MSDDLSLKSCYLFIDIPDDILLPFLAQAKTRTIQLNEIIVHEGEVPDTLYVIKHGNFVVIKRDNKTHYQHHIISLKKGDTIGEVSLIDSLPRSAFVQAKSEAELFVFTHDILQQFAKEHPNYYSQIIKNIAKKLSLNLRYSNEVVTASLTAQLEQAVMRVKMGVFIVSIISILCVYAFLLSFTYDLARKFNTDLYASIVVLFIILIPTLFVIKHDKFKLRDYGVNIHHWRKNLLEAFVFTLPVLLLAVIIKSIAIHIVPILFQEPLFNGALLVHRPNAYILLLIYILSCPIQEFIVRGILQTSLQKFLVSTSPWLAIIASNAIYSTLHLYLSFFYAVVTFIPGLFFGWLYARQKSLVGPIFSHILFGVWGIYILGIHALIR